MPTKIDSLITSLKDVYPLVLDNRAKDARVQVGQCPRYVPQILICPKTGASPFWLYVEQKKSQGYMEKWDASTHGIDYLRFNDFRSVQNATGWPVVILFSESLSRTIPRPRDLYITLTSVFQVGHKALNWPSKKKPGLEGQGGMTWRVSDMRELVPGAPLILE